MVLGGCNKEAVMVRDLYCLDILKEILEGALDIFFKTNGGS